MQLPNQLHLLISQLRPPVPLAAKTAPDTTACIVQSPFQFQSSFPNCPPHPFWPLSPATSPHDAEAPCSTNNPHPSWLLPFHPLLPKQPPYPYPPPSQKPAKKPHPIPSFCHHCPANIPTCTKPPPPPTPPSKQTRARAASPTRQAPSGAYPACAFFQFTSPVITGRYGGVTP